MAVKVSMMNPESGEVRHIKVGWNWPMFLFSLVFGIPLFMKGLRTWGWIMIAFCAAAFLLATVVPDTVPRSIAIAILQFAVLGLEIRHGRFGNEETARYLLSSGWRFAEPDGLPTKFARLQ